MQVLTLPPPQSSPEKWGQDSLEHLQVTMKIRLHKRRQGQENTGRRSRKSTAQGAPDLRSSPSPSSLWLCTWTGLGFPICPTGDKNPTLPTPCGPRAYRATLSPSVLCPPTPSVTTTSARRGREVVASQHTAQLDSLPPAARPEVRSERRADLRACTRNVALHVGTHAHRKARTAHLHPQMCATHQTHSDTHAVLHVPPHPGDTATHAQVAFIGHSHTTDKYAYIFLLLS